MRRTLFQASTGWANTAGTAAALAACAGTLPAQARPAPHPIALVVVIVVDQLRPDYLSRYGPQLTGGLHRLLSGGAVFEHGQQAHAITETAPGHATILSGREPAHTGIVSNALGVPDSTAPVLGSDDRTGASPRRFQGTTLVDWLRQRDGATRVLSVSRKDRGAILTVGRARVPVFWYADGGFTTSRYYADTLPAWVRAYDARGGARQLAGGSWLPLLPDSAYTEPDTVAFENGGADVAFPHVLAGDPDTAARRVVEYPWMDSLTLDFALAGAHALGLGGRKGPDLLSVALSTTDAIGHAYGPDSREIHDQVLRLDRWLGAFLDSLARQTPRARTLVVLTSDHGVQSFPEYERGIRHRPAGRVWLGDLAAGAAAALAPTGRWRPAIAFESGLVSADTAELRRRGVRLDSLAAALARDAAARPGVARVFTPASLARAPAGDREAMLWRRQLPAALGWLVCASLAPGYVWSPGRRVAEHGSTAPADVEVPIIFMGPGIRARHVARPVRTVDIAPTLAALLGIRAEEPIDGQVLPEVVRRR